MVVANTASSATAADEPTSTARARRGPQGRDPSDRPAGARIGVQLKYGSGLETLQVFPDGLTFRAPAALTGGSLVELVLCSGTVLVDAHVVQCQPLHDADGGHAVRVRYHETSEELVELITAELRESLEHSDDAEPEPTHRS